MNRMKKPQAGIPGRIVLAGLISVSILLICSKNSPLYLMNDWVDVNCFFTVGRGMRHGLTPYLDLYEQKGPLLNYGFLDGGFYFAAETLPVTRFFCTLNNDLEEMQRELRSAVSEGKAEFIVTRQQKLKDTGRYQLIDEAEMIFEGRVWTYYLYQRKTR